VNAVAGRVFLIRLLAGAMRDAVPLVNLPPPGVCRELRERWGLSMNFVASLLAVDPKTVSAVEHGKRSRELERDGQYVRLLAVLSSYEPTPALRAVIAGEAA
jgi:DNA-binding XRE family transcriptional regulator